MPLGFEMPFLVQANIDDHTLSVTTETAKEAFAKAVEWDIAYRMSGIIITDDVRSYTIDEFSSAMAVDEIANIISAEKSRKQG
jgi:hypothetical protein